MLNRNHKYIKFVLEKLKNSLYSSGFDITGTDANKALNFLVGSDDILRDIFILAKYKQCGSLCSYLLFVYKKLDENSLKYENLPVNIEYDVEYLKRIIIGSFRLNKSNGEVVDEPEPIIAEGAQQQWEVSDEISESKFKVGEIERDIVTEEFSEDEIDIAQFKDLNPEDEETIEEIISVSLAEIKESFVEDEEPESEQEQISHTNQTTPQEHDEKQKEEEREEAFDLSDLIETKQPEQKTVIDEHADDEKPTKETEAIKEEKIILSEEEKEPIKEQELDEESIVEISSEHLEASGQEDKTDHKEIEYEDTHILEENEAPSQENDELEEETPVPDEKNKRFVEFERKLVAVNTEMTLCFDEIERLIKNYDDNNSIIKDKSEFILQKAFMLAKLTGEMTFEIISNMYSFMGNYFQKANNIPFEIRHKDVSIFSYSLRVIEKFILEEDFSGIEKILGDYYEVEKYVEEMKQQEKIIYEQELKSGEIDTTSSEAVIESLEEIAQEKNDTSQEVMEEKPTEEQKHKKVLYDKKEKTSESKIPEARDSDSRRKMMIVLKAEIMELEMIFKSIDEIEGEYKIYEGLRMLSKTYNILKKTVALSKRLDMNKLARLSEACYIFIKFIQNYRLSPFDEDIKQIFNYIVYNYKLIALDKPTKDFEEFVFYLNDPVKIFTQKKKN